MISSIPQPQEVQKNTGRIKSPLRSPPLNNPHSSSFSKVNPSNNPGAKGPAAARSPNATPVPNGPTSPPLEKSVPNPKSDESSGVVVGGTGLGKVGGLGSALPRLSNTRRISPPQARSGSKSPEMTTPTGPTFPTGTKLNVVHEYPRPGGGAGPNTSSANIKLRQTTAGLPSFRGVIEMSTSNLTSPPRQRVVSMPPPKNSPPPNKASATPHRGPIFNLDGLPDATSPSNASPKLKDKSIASSPGWGAKANTGSMRSSHRWNAKVNTGSSPSMSQKNSGIGLGRARTKKAGSSVSSLGPSSGVPWAPGGVLRRLSSKLPMDSPPRVPKSMKSGDFDYTPSQPDSRRASAMESIDDWDESDDMEMMTEVVEGGEIDDRFREALDHIKRAHTTKTTELKRLLERTQTACSAQLHASQAELQLLRDSLQEERAQVHEAELKRERERLSHVPHQEPSSEWDLTRVLQGDGRGLFNDGEVRKAIRALTTADRLRLNGIILDACMPGDITAQILMLEKYQKSAFDILGTLPSHVAIKCLLFLDVQSLITGPALVSKKWNELTHDPGLWRVHCLELTCTDPVPLRPPPNAIASDWETLFKNLWHRERNWSEGRPQSIRFLKGHTGFCTTALLKGKRLITGSYDKTIRIWDVSTGEEEKCLLVKKPVSCIDFLVEEEVFVVGFHDIGRVYLYSTVTFARVQKLQGHLYGIRAVALSAKYLVSAGADKALVCWEWRTGNKIVRWGQQTNLNIGVQILDTPSTGERVVSVTIDGIVRVFSIEKRDMISQFRLSDMGGCDPVLSSKIFNVGVGSHNMLQWFAAHGTQITCATKSIILHLQWTEIDGEMVMSPKEVTSPSGSAGGAPPPSIPRSRTTSALSFTKSSARTPRRQSGPILGVGIRSNTPTMVSPLTPLSNAATPAVGGRDVARRLSLNTASPGSTSLKSAILTAPPKLVALIETPDVALGAVDPRKRRVVTATRFSSRSGADRRIFISTHRPRQPVKQDHGDDQENDKENDNESAEGSGINPNTYFGNVDSDGNSLTVDVSTSISSLSGVWAALAHWNQTSGSPDIKGLIGGLPPNFTGLATPALNPMVLALSHEEVVVGCADGTIYVMNFVGHTYRREAQQTIDEEVKED